MVVLSVRIHSFYFSMLQRRGGNNMCVGETKISYHMWELINKLSAKMWKISFLCLFFLVFPLRNLPWSRRVCCECTDEMVVFTFVHIGYLLHMLVQWDQVEVKCKKLKQIEKSNIQRRKRDPINHTRISTLSLIHNLISRTETHPLRTDDMRQEECEQCFVVF